MDPITMSLLSSTLGGGGGGGGVNPLGFLSAGAQSAMGLYQLLTAPKRPQLEIPKSALENKSLAQNAYAEGTPTAAYQNQQANIARNATAGLYTASKTRNSANAIAGIVGATNAATGNLNAQDALDRVRNRERLMQVNNQIANYEMQQQQDRIAQAVQQRAAGWQNVWGGLQGVTNLAMYGGNGRGKTSANTSVSPNQVLGQQLQDEYSLMQGNYAPNANYDPIYNPFYSYQSNNKVSHYR